MPPRGVATPALVHHYTWAAPNAKDYRNTTQQPLETTTHPLESPSGLGSKRTGFDVAAKFQCSQRKLPPVGSIWVEVAQEVGH